MQPKTSIRALRSEAGFTLLELMFTIALAAILMAMAIPSFRSMIANNRLTTQANDVIGAINYARSEAISHNGTVTFCRAATEAANTCVTATGDWQFWIVRNAAGTVVRSGAISTNGGILRVSSSLALDALAYSSDGMGRSGGALITSRTFTVCVNNVSTDNIRTVTLGAGSRISTAKSSGGC
jgi:type IV fimbrial biogenesis protein FimT